MVQQDDLSRQQGCRQGEASGGKERERTRGECMTERRQEWNGGDRAFAWGHAERKSGEEGV